MTYDGCLSCLTDEELIREFRVSDDPTLSELVNRLMNAIDEPQAEIAELTKDVEELENATCDECKKHETKIERLKDEYEDRIAELDEQIAHERSRIKEFHDENQQFLAEIERLKSAATTPIEKETTMLETQIERLTERVAAVETKQDRTNELLGEILNAIREGGTTPPAPAQIVKARPVSGKKTKAGKPGAVAEPTKDEGEKEAPLILEDVREALMEVKEKHGREAAVEIVEQFSGGMRKVSAIPEDKYSDVLAACGALDRKEAA